VRDTLTVTQALKMKKYWPKLVGCAGGWFLFDVTFYGNTLFAPTVLRTVFHVDPSQGTPTDGNTLETNLSAQLAILALIGLPGYYVSVFLMDRLGRKIIQLQGFLMMAVVYGFLAIYLEQLQTDSALLLVVYGLTYFFSNFGPNSTTFILPAETFPPEVRSTFNGICAAMGKLGATFGAAGFKPMVDAFGSEIVFASCAGCALLGLLITFFFVEDRRGGKMAGESFINDPNLIQNSLLSQRPM